MATSIVLKCMETQRFKRIIFESSLYSNNSDSLILNTEKVIKKILLPRLKNNSSVVCSNSSVCSTGTEFQKNQNTRFLLIERETVEQRLFSKDIIYWLLSKLHKMKNSTTKEREQDFSRE
mmetsp:Transcript_12207/g.10825  ORF Transcript_12207/g.10825 Transcript_12207/m.10825 type:complete len:120 (+) Transcript_12207:383-742(+)